MFTLMIYCYTYACTMCIVENLSYRAVCTFRNLYTVHVHYVYITCALLVPYNVNAVSCCELAV